MPDNITDSSNHGSTVNEADIFYAFFLCMFILNFIFLSSPFTMNMNPLASVPVFYLLFRLPNKVMYNYLFC